MKKELSHIDPSGNPKMVDVSNKKVTLRTAKAEAVIKVGTEIMEDLEANNFESKKGPVIQTAIIAGTMGAKKTSEMIPFCHQIPLEKCKIRVDRISSSEFKISCIVSTHAKTGVEMEALTGANIAALTIYDMTKAMSHDIEITSLRLIEKTGGKSDYKR